MTSYLKALGLALMACLALGAVGATSASADLFKSDNEKTVITAADDPEDQTVFGIHSVPELSVKCTEATYAGTTSKKEVTEVTVVPTYDGCSADPLGEAIVDTEGCDYTLNTETTSHSIHPSTGRNGEETHASVDLECTPEVDVAITVPGCTITIWPQTGLHGVTYDNITENGKGSVQINVTVDGIEYTTEGFVCELAELPEHGEDGTLTGTVLATGYEDKDTSPGPHQDEFKEGNQINIEVDDTE